jgi:hypothetical protein
MTLMTKLDAARRFRIRRNKTHQIRPTNPRPQRRDCQGQLLAALDTLAGSDDAIADASMRPWCSATFLGAQHRILLRLSGDHAAQQAERLRAQLPDTDFKLRGHIVADIMVDEIREEADGIVLVSLSVLTIEDW